MVDAPATPRAAAAAHGCGAGSCPGTCQSAAAALLHCLSCPTRPAWLPAARSPSRCRRRRLARIPVPAPSCRRRARRSGRNAVPCRVSSTCCAQSACPVVSCRVHPACLQRQDCCVDPMEPPVPLRRACSKPCRAVQTWDPPVPCSLRASCLNFANEGKQVERLWPGPAYAHACARLGDSRWRAEVDGESPSCQGRLSG